MSNTSYQRGVADMQAAGINPMLAAMKGGASSPTGQMAPVTTPNLQTATAIPRTTHYNDVYHSAQQGQRMNREIEKVGNENRLLDEYVTHEKLKQEWTKAQRANTQAQTATEQERKFNVTADTTLKSSLHSRNLAELPHLANLIKSSISHNYSGASLNNARSLGQGFENRIIKDVSDYVDRNPGLRPRIEDIQKGSNSASSVLHGIGSLLPWRSSSTITHPNGSTTNSQSRTGKW